MEGGNSQSAVKQYCGGVRLALSLLDKPHSQIDLSLDLDRVRTYLAERDLKPSTLAGYHKGLSKLTQYLRYRRSQPEPERPVAWEKYLAPFTSELAADIRAYIDYRGRSWHPEQQRQATLNLLSHLTGMPRGLGCSTELTEITPLLWLDYVERRLQAGIQSAILVVNRTLKRQDEADINEICKAFLHPTPRLLNKIYASEHMLRAASRHALHTKLILEWLQ